MSWDIGAITGGIKFDISDFTHGMVESEALMRAFPPIVSEFLESPLLAVVAIAREAAHAIGEIVSEAMTTARSIDLAAQKAGMGVEEFSRLAEAAKFVSVGVDQLGVGMRMLQLHASDAVGGSKEAAEAFRSVGISVQFLRAHLNDTGALWGAVQKAIDRIPPGADRAAASIHLLGRAGSDLVPLLSMGSEKINELADKAAQWGAVETKESAEAAAAWTLATTEMGFAWDGLKKIFAESVAPRLIAEMNTLLTWVQGHMPEIRQHIERIADAVVKAVDVIGPMLIYLMEHLDGVVAVLGTGALLKVVASAIASVNLLGDAFVALAAKIELATAAQIAFGIAKTGAIGAGIGALTTGGLGGTIGGGVGGVVGGLIGTAIAPGVGTYIGTAAGGYLGGVAGGAIENHYHTNVTTHFDPAETSRQVADKITPQIQEEYRRQKQMVVAATHHQRVASGIGGRH